MGKPNFEKLSPLFASQEDFALTETQYRQSTGADLPKNTYYLVNNSALSRCAKEKGYSIEVIEKTICLKKIS